MAHRTVRSLIQMYDHQSVRKVTGHSSSYSARAETASRNQASMTSYKNLVVDCIERFREIGQHYENKLTFFHRS